MSPTYPIDPVTAVRRFTDGHAARRGRCRSTGARPRSFAGEIRNVIRDTNT